MFTGIVEDVGKVVHARGVGGDLRLRIALDRIQPEKISLGDSVAVNGACLTVVGIDGNELDFDVSRESLANTTIADWKAGMQVNLELALLPTTRLGGHLVSGHVDGVATIDSVRGDARSTRITLKCPAALQRYIASKGSVTLDGVSLTVNEVQGDTFGVNIVPHTLEVTTLGQRVAGDRLHMEADLVARYIDQLLRNGTVSEDPAGEASLEDKLAGSGFLG